jgi:phosphatidylserine decarboxylase
MVDDANAPVRYYHRYRARLETEQVYGERWLRWAYGNPLGRACVSLLASRAWFSRWFGWRMRRPASRRLIRPFVARYGIDMEACEEPLDGFPHFDAFFVRRLRPEARPIDADWRSVVFPADGRHLGFPLVNETQRVFVKGQSWDLAALLGSRQMAACYAGGTLVLSRLCPVDYHHFHFPAAGVAGPARRLPGRLYSVHPYALRRQLACLWQNQRDLTILRTGIFGDILQLEIGATNVGTIEQGYLADAVVAKGARKGAFHFGGSSVITLFPPGRVTLAADLLEWSAQGIELYAHYGDGMGHKA